MREPDANPTQGFKATDHQLDWTTEEQYWQAAWSQRPYVRADQSFETYRPAYRYGFESASRDRGRRFEDVEPDLRTGWDRYEHRGQRAWESIKEAVRDGWNRVNR